MANDDDITKAVKAALAAEREAKARSNSLEYMNQQLEAETRLLGAYEKTARTQEGRFLKAQQESKVLQQQIEILQTQAKLSGDFSQETLDQIKHLERAKEEADFLAQQIEKAHVSLQQSVQAAESLAQKLSPVGVWASEYANNTILSTSAFRELSIAIQGGTTALKVFVKSLFVDTALGFVDAIIGLAFAADRMEASFRKSTGTSAGMARELTGVYEATRLAGVSMDEARGAAVALYTTYTDFTMVTPQVRSELAQTVSLLGEFGVSSTDAASSLQTMTKAMSLTGPEAGKALVGIKSYGQAIGVTPQQMTREFNAASGALSKLGSDGVRAFKDLARVAKITGVEVGRLLQMTAEFDTFEGAATMAGKLNAALGSNFVNAMDLMMETDPVERFRMIRDSITDAGLSFDTMSYYQRRFFTQQLGFKDEAELAAALSGDLDSLGMGVQKTEEDYRKMREEAAAMQSVQEQLRNLFLDMVPVLMPLIDALRQFVGWMRQNPDLIKKIVVVGGALLSLFVAFKVAMMAATAVSVAWNGAKEVSLGLWKALTFWKKKDSSAMSENIVQVVKGTAAAGAFALKAVALGSALYMVSLGLGEMAKGFGDFIKSTGELEAGEMEFLKEMFLGMAVAVGGLTLALGLLGAGVDDYAGGAAIAAVGVAFVGFSYGIKLVSEGLGILIDKFRQFLGAPTSAADLKLYSTSLTTMGTAMAGLGGPGLKAGAGLGAMAIGLGLVGLAMKFIGDDLPMLVLFAEAVQNLVGAMEELDSAKGFETVRNELENWDAATVTKLGLIATGLSAVGFGSAPKPEAAGATQKARGTTEDSPLIVRDISSKQTVKIVMDAAETRRFLREGTIDTIGEVVRESLEGAQ